MWPLFFIFGLIVGSFLNVVISRLPRAESLLGRSHCPKCKSRIRWHDNIPLLSFAILGTRCRDCREKISWKYPLVEGATAVIFVAVGQYFFDPLNPQSWLESFYYLAIFSIFIVIFVYDLKHMEIPMIAVWMGVLLAISYNIYSDVSFFDSAWGIMSSRLFSAALAGLTAFLFFFILSAGSREKWMGMGDAYVALLAGLVVGWPGILAALFLAFAIGAIYGIILIARGKKTMKSQVPFAPFLAIGAALAVFFPKIFPAVSFWRFYFC